MARTSVPTDPEGDPGPEPSSGLTAPLPGQERVSWLIDKILIPAIFVYMLYTFVSATPYPASTQAWVEYILNWLRYSIVPIFLLTSRRSRATRLNARGLAGIVLSVGAPVLFRLHLADDSWYYGARAIGSVEISHAFIIFAVGSIYTVLLIAAYFNLGRNLSIAPAFKAVVTAGLYSMVRHPVYAATVHLAAIFAIVYPSLFNFACLAALNVGIWLRMLEEETLLSRSDEYRAYLESVPLRAYSPVISSPLVFLAVLRLLT